MKKRPHQLKKEFGSFNNDQYHHYDYWEIESLIDDVFKNEKHKSGYELPCYEEIGQCDLVIDVKKQVINSYNRKEIEEKLLVGKWPHYNTSTFLTELCNRGIIKAGTYIINVRW